LTVLLLMSTLLLAGCNADRQIVVMVPSLDAPPPGTIKALENQCKVKKDSATCQYIVKLDKHYQKLDTVPNVVQK